MCKFEIMIGWHDFFIATAGASAALTGLIFVGVSINLNKILAIPSLPSRALISLMLLLTILIASLILLVPSESISTLAIEIIIIGLISWAAISKVDYDIFKNKVKQFRRVYLLHMSVNQIAILPYIICGLYLFKGDASGMYWLVVSIIFSFLKASLDAWVLLIEINR
jgi:hypothetical protein